MKKVVVLGATGMAGHLISLYLEENGYDVFRMSRSCKNTEKCAAIDASDLVKLEKWLDEIKPEIIINCIGILNQSAEKRPDLAILLNSYLPQWLCNKFQQTSTKIIHLSTDCVFSGETGGYKENSVPDGKTIYDRTKALGEIDNDKDLTFRMSIIGPDIDEKGIGLFNWFMKQSGEINGYSKAIWNGITTIELAHAIDSAIKHDLKGLYHLTSKKTINKYDLTNLFKAVFNKQDVSIIPFQNVGLDKSLINTRTDFAYEIPSYEEMVKEMKHWIYGHKELYNNRY